jgi:erythronate-4-phosphate dehydrogenase
LTAKNKPLLNLIADKNIPLVESLFTDFAEVSLLPGGELTNRQIADADILLVRSTTQVNKHLLTRTKVKFVGTATAGTDHIDLAYLQQADIGFSAAPGCNANAVTEYVLTALFALLNDPLSLASKQVAIIGFGHVGRCLYHKLQRLGVAALVYDPLLSANAGLPPLASWQQVLAADILTFHPCLTRGGTYPSYHMFDRQAMAGCKSGALVINTSRGEVMDNQALLDLLEAGKDLKVVLDVWEHEPNINLDLLPLVTLATPHIAGYSLEAKVQGTVQLYQAVCQYFGLLANKPTAALVPSHPLAAVQIDSQLSGWEREQQLAQYVYDIWADDGCMRDALMDQTRNCGIYFDELRENYPVRREYSAYL